MSDTPHLTRTKQVPIGKKMDDLFKRPIYIPGDGEVHQPQRPGSAYPYTLPSRGLI